MFDLADWLFLAYITNSVIILYKKPNYWAFLTVSLARPLRRLACKTLTPEVVALRTKNP